VNSGATLCIAALALCGCAAATRYADLPKDVRGYPLPPYQIHEECVSLRPGDRLDYAFDSPEPVDFNIHYHEGNAVVMPVVREKARADAGMYTAQIAQDYCLMWEAGAPGATIDYRIRRKPGKS
jgi:hypothetical protein